MDKKDRSLSSVRIAFMYFGVLMGAGFASGREIWQFFGVFGPEGLFGILIIATLFVLLGFLIVAISSRLSTNDLSKIILPFNSPIAEKITGIVVASFLFMGFFSMLAAGGALVEQQFAIHRGIGSLALMLLVTFTAVKGFHKVSSRIGKVTPVLLFAALLVSLILIIDGGGGTITETTFEASPLAPNWLIAAIVFISYNALGAIPILGSCTIYASSLNKARIGAVLGGIFLGGCALIIYFATQTDPGTASQSPLPMLALAQGISPLLRSGYAAVLVISVFGTATSCFYAVSTRIKESKYKARILWVLAFVGLACSMMGFSRIVAVVYPLEGYIGVVLILLMVINYYRLRRGLGKW